MTRRTPEESAGVDDLLLPEGDSQKFIDDIEKEKERSARAMGSTHHVRQAMEELSAARDAPIVIRAKAPISDRRDARAFPAPVGGHDTLIDAPKVRLSPFGRDEPTVLTKRTRQRRSWFPVAAGVFFFGAGAFLVWFMLQPSRTGMVTSTRLTGRVPAAVVPALTEKPVATAQPSEAPTATAVPTAPTSAKPAPPSTSGAGPKWIE